MKQLLITLALIPLLSNAQWYQTYVPDDNFEQVFINLGLDWQLDDSVGTFFLDTISFIDASYSNISDLTGIEECDSLWGLNCENNNLTTLNLSNAHNLEFLRCGDNQLINLDLRNGNNINMNTSSSNFNTTNNPELYCIDVDDTTWANINWTFANGNLDSQHGFNLNCSITTTLIDLESQDKYVVKILDVLGKERKIEPNTILFFIHRDGTIEKKIILE